MTTEWPHHGPLPKWSELFPDGRHIFYEGDDPDGFEKIMKDEFGIDLAAQKSWREPIEPDRPGGEPFISYGFFCPPEHLDAVYGTDRFTLGS